MTTITFLGGEETGNVAYVDWGRFRFQIGQPVECDDPHIVAKASANRFFRVGEEAKADPPARDPLDHDGDGKKGGSVARRGRPPKGVEPVAGQTSDEGVRNPNL